MNQEKLLEKYKAIWTKIEDLLNSIFFKSSILALRDYDDRYTKTKLKTYSDKMYTNSCG